MQEIYLFLFHQASFPYARILPSYQIKLLYCGPGIWRATLHIFWNALIETSISIFLRVKLTSNIWFPHRESNPGRLGENQKSFFSKFIACCITCRRNGTGSFSLISPDVSFLNSKVSQYPAAPHGLVPSSLYEILLGI